MQRHFSGWMRGGSCVLGLLAAIAATGAFGSSPPAGVQNETLVFVRHGEKPEGGYGQVNCQGLNRALALPRVLAAKFGKPDFIFAPDPSFAAHDPAGDFDYVRPLATIEPTAVALGMPINTQYGFLQVDALQAELLRPRYRNALVFIAWEHTMAESLARLLTSADGEIVPYWESGDYDSIYIVRIRTEGNERHARFEQANEGLNGQSTTCAFAP